jgi:hypothetical protein
MLRTTVDNDCKTVVFVKVLIAVLTGLSMNYGGI